MVFFFTLFVFTLLGSGSVLAQSTVDFSSVRVTGDRETNDVVHLDFHAHLMPMEQNWRCTADLRTGTSTSASKTGTCNFLDVRGMAFELSFSLRDPLPIIDQTAGTGSLYSLMGPLILDFTYYFGVDTVEPINFAMEVPTQYLIDENVAMNPSIVSFSSPEVVSIDAMNSDVQDVVLNQ